MTIKTIIISILFFSLGSGCKFPDPKDVSDKIKFEASFQLNIKEPSGLDLSLDGNLWVVSDKSGEVFLITKKGEILKSFKVDGNDFEGITQIDENKLAIVCEEKSEIIITDFDGNIIKRNNIAFAKKGSSGMEGITYDKSSKNYFVVNEKNPRMLFTLDENLNLLQEKEIKKVKDLSGIFYEENEKVLWIVSDESKAIVKFHTNGEFLEKYEIDIPQAEGIAVEYNEKKIYLVSDKTGMLYVYSIL